jgi:hypothetical protein
LSVLELFGTVNTGGVRLILLFVGVKW